MFQSLKPPVHPQANPAARGIRPVCHIYVVYAGREGRTGEQLRSCSFGTISHCKMDLTLGTCMYAQVLASHHTPPPPVPPAVSHNTGPVYLHICTWASQQVENKTKKPGVAPGTRPAHPFRLTKARHDKQGLLGGGDKKVILPACLAFGTSARGGGEASRLWPEVPRGFSVARLVDLGMCLSLSLVREPDGRAILDSSSNLLPAIG